MNTAGDSSLSAQEQKNNVSRQLLSVGKNDNGTHFKRSEQCTDYNVTLGPLDTFDIFFICWFRRRNNHCGSAVECVVGDCDHGASPSNNNDEIERPIEEKMACRDDIVSETAVKLCDNKQIVSNREVR